MKYELWYNKNDQPFKQAATTKTPDEFGREVAKLLDGITETDQLFFSLKSVETKYTYVRLAVTYTSGVKVLSTHESFDEADDACRRGGGLPKNCKEQDDRLVVVYTNGQEVHRVELD